MPVNLCFRYIKKKCIFVANHKKPITITPLLQKIVIIPTYNERENISSIVTAIFALDQQFHVLVIDDNSPDGTAEIVKEMQPDYADQLFIEERKGKQGLGTAYIYGFRWALAKGYTFIFEMDADFSHNPKDLENLFEACLH